MVNCEDYPLISVVEIDEQLPTKRWIATEGCTIIKSMVSHTLQVQCTCIKIHRARVILETGIHTRTCCGSQGVSQSRLVTFDCHDNNT